MATPQTTPPRGAERTSVSLRHVLMTVIVALTTTTAGGGPYTDLPVNGYIDPNTWRHTDPQEPNAVLNPIFRGWATSFRDYLPADDKWSGPAVFNNAANALGPATGDNVSDIVSLGELDRTEIARRVPPGQITLVFGDPCDPADDQGIRNGAGYDFAVFENAFVSQFTTLTGSFGGQMLAELGYVEVSSNGTDFVRFASVSLTADRVGPFGTIEVSNVYNLAGKHPNAYGVCTGTPFDLDELAEHPDVVSGLVDLNDIRYVRIVDVPGAGNFFDQATSHVDPATWPGWLNYAKVHPVYDAWLTTGSGGFDLEAVGVLHEQTCAADLNLDGRVDVLDLMLLASAWQSHFGRTNWIGRADLAQPEDLFIDGFDFAVFASQWRHVEPWRAECTNQ